MLFGVGKPEDISLMDLSQCVLQILASRNKVSKALQYSLLVILVELCNVISGPVVNSEKSKYSSNSPSDCSSTLTSLTLSDTISWHDNSARSLDAASFKDKSDVSLHDYEFCELSMGI